MTRKRSDKRKRWPDPGTNRPRITRAQQLWLRSLSDGDMIPISPASNAKAERLVKLRLARVRDKAMGTVTITRLGRRWLKEVYGP